MKKTLTKLFWPILRFFETEEESQYYKKSHRVILIIVGFLFVSLSLGSAVSAYSNSSPGAFMPVVIFFSVGLVAIVVGSLGSNSSVSKIWGNK